MRKKLIAIIGILTALLLVFTPLYTAYAKTAGVTYEGDSQRFVFLPESTDLFQGFKGVMPGDELSQDIYVSNDSDNEVILYLRAEIPEDGNKDFLDQMVLTVYGLNREKIYEGKSGKAGSLSEGYDLGSLKPGDEGKLVAKLQVPIDMDNTYQSQIGKISWIFSAQEVEEIPEEPVPLTPPTGDQSIGIWLYAVAFLALTGIGAILAFKKSKASL